MAAANCDTSYRYTYNNSKQEQDETNRHKEEKEEKTGNDLECSICFDSANDPVVTQCGHLFCWPCIEQWLHTENSNEQCPVCNGHISLDSLIPIYGRGQAKSTHSKNKPKGKRKPAPNRRRSRTSDDPFQAFFAGPFGHFGTSFRFDANSSMSFEDMTQDDINEKFSQFLVFLLMLTLTLILNW